MEKRLLDRDGGGADPPSDLSLEDCDILRHREITSKAVSAILILTLKWFKASRTFLSPPPAPIERLTDHSLLADVMKFHYFSQLLVDSNCLLLILKMFGLQEVSTLVRIKHDRADYKCVSDSFSCFPSLPAPALEPGLIVLFRPDRSFFKFCHDHINPSPSGSPSLENALGSLPPIGARPSSSSAPGSSSSPTSSPPPGTLCASPTSTEEPPSSQQQQQGQQQQQQGPGGVDVELVSDYSWRNFFSTINFVHILQKLTKRKTHRVLLMVQYKSSVRTPSPLLFVRTRED